MDSDAYENKRSANVVSREQSDWKIVAMQRYCFKDGQGIRSDRMIGADHANYVILASRGAGNARVKYRERELKAIITPRWLRGFSRPGLIAKISSPRNESGEMTERRTCFALVHVRGFYIIIIYNI